MKRPTWKLILFLILAITVCCATAAATKTHALDSSKTKTTVRDGLSFTTQGCSAKHRKLIFETIKTGKEFVEDVLRVESGQIMGNLTREGHRALRQRYFGDLSREDSNYVTGVFQKMQGNWSEVIWKCPLPGTLDDINCDERPISAFVPFFSDIVTICPATLQRFSEAFLEGESIFGLVKTAIHEMAHTFKVGYPHDIHDIQLEGSLLISKDRRNLGLKAYGEWKAQALARMSPSAAVLNADNYAWYALAIRDSIKSGVKAVKSFDGALSLFEQTWKSHERQCRNACLDGWPNPWNDLNEREKQYAMLAISAIFAFFALFSWLQAKGLEIHWQKASGNDESAKAEQNLGRIGSLKAHFRRWLELSTLGLIDEKAEHDSYATPLRQALIILMHTLPSCIVGFVFGYMQGDLRSMLVSLLVGPLAHGAFTLALDYLLNKKPSKSVKALSSHPLSYIWTLAWNEGGKNLV